MPPVSLVGELHDGAPRRPPNAPKLAPFRASLTLMDASPRWCSRNAWMLRGKGQSGVCLGFPTASCLLNVHGGLCFSGVLPVPALPTTVSYYELHQCGKRFDIIIHLIDCEDQIDRRCCVTPSLVNRKSGGYPQVPYRV